MRPVDGAFLAALDREFPMGYATLVVLEKVSPAKPRARCGTAAGMDEFCVFADPLQVHVGSGATIPFHRSHVAAIKEARRKTDEGLRCIAVRVVERMTWH